ncbi:acyl carrier protein [Sorangium sp. So ce281]|uniref:acyl carrier protein n=1 Tax=unclassified Sorangium TaxID=2621164 RepID=UPI003F60F980
MSEFEPIVVRVLRDIPDLRLPEGRIDPDVPLANYGMNSLCTIQLIAGIEATCHITFEDADLVDENFLNLRNICACVARRRGAASR